MGKHQPSKKLNALNQAVLAELNSLFIALNEDENVRVIVLTGSGEKAFVAGADISEFAEFDAAEGEALSRQGHEKVLIYRQNAEAVLRLSTVLLWVVALN